MKESLAAASKQQLRLAQYLRRRIQMGTGMYEYTFEYAVSVLCVHIRMDVCAGSVLIAAAAYVGCLDLVLDPYVFDFLV